MSDVDKAHARNKTISVLLGEGMDSREGRHEVLEMIKEDLLKPETRLEPGSLNADLVHRVMTLVEGMPEHDAELREIEELVQQVKVRDHG